MAFLYDILDLMQAVMIPKSQVQFFPALPSSFVDPSGLFIDSAGNDRMGPAPHSVQDQIDTGSYDSRATFDAFAPNGVDAKGMANNYADVGLALAGYGAVRLALAGAPVSNAGKALNKVLDTKAGDKLFGKRGILNSNDKIRIGTGFRSRPQGGVDKVFRVGTGKGRGANQSKKIIEILLKEFPKR